MLLITSLRLVTAYRLWLYTHKPERLHYVKPNEAELIQEDYTKKGIDKLYNNIVEFQELNNLNIKAFEEKAENVETKSILENITYLLMQK